MVVGYSCGEVFVGLLFTLIVFYGLLSGSELGLRQVSGVCQAIWDVLAEWFYN